MEEIISNDKDFDKTPLKRNSTESNSKALKNNTTKNKHFKCCCWKILRQQNKSKNPLILLLRPQLQKHGCNS